MCDKNIIELIKGINESIDFTKKSDFIISIKKCRECEPVRITINKSCWELGNVDRSEESKV